MNKAVEILRECGVFHIATTEGDQPRVRPFAPVADIEGKLYICTSNDKKCFRQMIANPKVELSALLGADRWVRITGILRYDSRMSSKVEFLRQMPSEFNTADDGLFEVLYFESGEMIIHTAKGPEVYSL